MINDIQIQDVNVEKILEEVISRIEFNDIQFETMPVASKKYLSQIKQYVGDTNDSYTNGCFYKCTGTPVYTSTVTFQPATISSTVVTCSGDAFASFVASITDTPKSIVKGTLSYDAVGNLWTFVGQDANDQTVKTYKVYQEDYEDAGFVFTGTPEDGDVVSFACTITESSVIYAWTQINVQPS